MNSLRIGQVTLSMHQGGIENLILSLGEAFNHDAVRCSLYCLDAGGELLDKAERLGMHTHVFKRRAGLDWRLIGKLSQQFRADRLQVVHTHNEAAHFYGCLAARLTRIPVVINTEHSRHYIDGHLRRQMEKRFLSLMTDRLVTVSTELSHCSMEKDRIKHEKIVVISNGINLQRFTVASTEDVIAFRSQEGIAPQTRIISIIARLNPIKNHPLLFRALTLLRKSYADVCLLVVGDGAEKANLCQLAADLDLSDIVKFLGNRSDVPIVLKASDMLVLCSESEGLPLTLLEAMAARVPVIVSRGSNRCGLIESGLNGRVCDDSPEFLARAMSDQLVETEHHQDMVEAAYKLVASKYSQEQMGREYEQLYRQCLYGQ